MKEKRKFKRLRAYHLVKYRVLGEEREREVRCAWDVSGGGLRLLSLNPLPLGTKLEIILNFPVLPYFLPVIGEVVWVRRVGKKSKRYYVGVKFLEIPEDIQEKIKEKIENVLKKLIKKEVS